jgi:allophanate hydrolase
MQLGKVEFADGTWRTAFGCDAAAAGAGTDIIGYASWPAAAAAAARHTPGGAGT